MNSGAPEGQAVPAPLVTQWPTENDQKNKQRSAKHTTKSLVRVTRTAIKENKNTTNI